jgi:hypothetical protein
MMTIFRAGALADDHAELVKDVEHRAAPVLALVDAHVWPHAELATLAGFLRASLLRQLSDEESGLYPHDATETPFAELSAAHGRLYALTHRLCRAGEQRCPLPELRLLIDDLLTTLRQHVAEEQEVLATLALRNPEPPADEGPVVIRLDALPTSVAEQLCLERLLRLRPGDRAEVYSGNSTHLRDLRAWLHEFDAAGFAVGSATTRDGGVRLQVACRARQ